MCDGVPFVERTGELSLHARLSRQCGAAAEANLKRVSSMQGETRSCSDLVMSRLKDG